MSTPQEPTKAPDAPHKLAKGLPPAMLVLFALAALFLVWAMFFKTT